MPKSQTARPCVHNPCESPQLNHSEQRLAGLLLVHEERDSKRAKEKAVNDVGRRRARLASEAVDGKVSREQCSGQTQDMAREP